MSHVFIPTRVSENGVIRKYREQCTASPLKINSHSAFRQLLGNKLGAAKR